MERFASTDGTILYYRGASTVGQKESFIPHSHPMFECSIYIRGNITFRAGSIEIAPAPKSMVIVPRGIVHALEADESAIYERYVVHFYPDVLPDSSRDYLCETLLSSIQYLENVDDILPDVILLEECFSMPEQIRKEAIVTRLSAMLFRLIAMFEDRERLQSSESLISRILEFIHANIGNISELTMDTLAQQFYISQSQLSKLFAREVGTSLAKYVRQQRFEYAELLRGQGVPATEAAIMAGFKSYSSYYRMRMGEIGEKGKPTEEGAQRC